MTESLHQLARFLIPIWPFLAACLLALLPEKRAAASARIFALSGILLTLLLIPFLSGQDLLARWSCLLAGCVPFLAWREREKRLTLSLNFLATSTIMLALCVHAVLTVACLTACCALLLALHETLATTRARQAWESMRLRLAGIVLTLLGASLTGLASDLHTRRLGDLFLAIGLCLLAGIGKAATTQEATPDQDRGTALLEALLCLSAVALMLRLPERDITHITLVVAGLAGLWLCVLTRQDGPRPLVALAIVAAALPHGLFSALLYLSFSVAVAASPSLQGPSRRWVLCGLPPWPSFAASCGVVAGLFSIGLLPVTLCLVALGAMASRADLRWIVPGLWRDRIVLLALLALGLASPFFMQSAFQGTAGWSLNWRAP
ncbi:hypothetical protein [Asaia astilbis]|uniref:hypothetical protein n=1 Tax=Asaia astilbis TaxID=610244 RepID=UPI0004711354|nr:hypothetical protein [Asaia astilbis]